MSLTIKDLHEGAEVYWTDPDEDIGSGYYKVDCILSDNIVVLTNEEGTVVEAFLHELK